MLTWLWVVSKMCEPKFGPKSDIRYIRKQIFHEIVPYLLADHNDGQLYAKLAKTSGRITNVTFQSIEITSTHHLVARMIVESSFEKCNVNQWTVVVHELEKEYFECVRVLVFGMRSRVFHICQSQSYFVINLSKNTSKCINWICVRCTLRQLSEAEAICYVISWLTLVNIMIIIKLMVAAVMVVKILACVLRKISPPPDIDAITDIR